jgi:hypothetical protein
MENKETHIEEILTQFRGTTFSSPQDVEDFLREKLEEYATAQVEEAEQRVKENMAKYLADNAHSDWRFADARMQDLISSALAPNTQTDV